MEGEKYSQILHFIELVKKAWYFGAMNNSEFNKFSDFIKFDYLYGVFPLVMGCFRLNKEFIIPKTSFKQVGELFSLAIGQAMARYDLLVISQLLTLASTYQKWTSKEDDPKEYVSEVLKHHKILLKKELWESYILYNLLKSTFMRVSSQDNSGQQQKKNILDQVVSVLMTMSIEILDVGVNKNMVYGIVKNYCDKFKVGENNRNNILGIIKNHS